MILADEDIAKYQQFVKKRHSSEISKEKALEEALSHIQFVRHVYKKPSAEEIDSYKKR
jgi:hypothetical protein